MPHLSTLKTAASQPKTHSQELNFYYLRTPLLALSQLLYLLERDALTAFLQLPHVGEAITVASPALYAQLLTDPGLTNKKLRQTALKYVLRMGSRPTPFGLFAACSLGQISEATHLDLTDHELVRHYWLSTNVLWKLVDYLNQQPTLRIQLRYQVNTSLYPLGAQFRYLEREPLVTKPRYYTSQIKTHPAIRLVLRKARHGATLGELTAMLEEKGYPPEQVLAYLDGLIADQILVSPLAINVTGGDSLSQLANCMKATVEGEPLAEQLRQIDRILAQNVPVGQIQAAIQTTLGQGFQLPMDESPLIQCDTRLVGMTHQLSRTVQAALKESFQRLLVLNPNQHPSESLNQFKRAFYTRYEEREIPLALALDAEAGIGYGKQTIGGDGLLIEQLLTAGRLADSDPESAPARSPVDKWRHELYDAWTEQGDAVLTLSDTDLTALPDTIHPLPDSFYAFGYFLAPSSQAIDAGNYFFRSKWVAGPSAFPLLGRFCRSDAELAQRIYAVFQQQERDTDRIHAEIVHLPSAEVGNVIQRPHLSDYEIPYLGHSTLPLEKQIRLDDLWISVPRGKRIVLRSKRLGKEVVPRLTTAHNYHTGLPVYRFLCDLQLQENALSFHWQWGDLEGCRFLPRVQYRQIILREAQWRLDWSDYQAGWTDGENLAAWRQQWHWPRLVALAQGDQELLLDLNHSGCQQLLISTLRRLKRLQLIEWLRTPDQCCVDGPNGKFTHEIVLPFRALKRRMFSVQKPTLTKSIQRTFMPGSEWVYLKVYCGPQTANLVLEKLGKLARATQRRGQISHWFFIRYEDPDHHLRIRFHVPKTGDLATLMTRFERQLQPFLVSGIVNRVQVDTYQREIERYGQERILATERLFWADSEFALSVSRQTGEEIRLAAALLGVNRYLLDWGYTLPNKALFCQERFQALIDAQGAKVSWRKQLAKLYRQNRELIDASFSDSTTATNSRIKQLLRKRNHRVMPPLAAICPTAPPPDYLASLIHLLVNRLFDQHQSTYELVVYHHLARTYQTTLARS